MHGSDVAFPTLRRLAGGLTAGTVVALLAACGSLTAGGLSETTVTVSGDAPDAVPVASTGAGAQADDAEIEGQIQARFLLFLDPLEGPSIQLTDAEFEVALDVRGQQEAVVVRRAIPSGRYAALRVVFSEIEVRVDAGLVVEGHPITGRVSVGPGIEGLTVIRSVVLDLEDGDSRELLVDLNTPAWLGAVDPDRLEVTGEAFASAIAVRVR